MELISRLALLIGGVVSLIIVFLIFLVIWNPLPAERIMGVQGRYFVIPFVMLAYGLSGGKTPYHTAKWRMALLLVLALGVTTAYVTPRLLVERYYLH